MANKRQPVFTHCEIGIATDEEGNPIDSAMQFQVWTDNGSPLGAQQIIDAISDAVLIEFGGLDSFDTGFKPN